MSTFLNEKKKRISSGLIVILLVGALVPFMAAGILSPADAASAYFASNNTITNNSAILNGETWIVATGVTLTIAPGVTVTNDGTIMNYGTVVNQGTIINYEDFTNRGMITNKAGATFRNSQSSDPGGQYGILSNYGTISNEAGASFYNSGATVNKESATFVNSGAFSNVGEGGLSNEGILENKDTGSILNGFIMGNSGYIYNFGNINNSGASFSNARIIYNYCGTTTGTVPSSGNPVDDMCYPDAPVFPATHMEDNTSTYGLSLYSARQAHVEMVTPTSELVGDSIDQIILKLRKTGNPTGTIEVGVFNSDLTVKKLFAVEDAIDLTTTYTDYTFSLPNNELHTIQADDRIGIKYSGGDVSNFVAVMIDNNAADPFDSTDSYHQYYTTSWQSAMSADLYMKLVQRHGPGAPPVTTHMYDTTQTYGLALNTNQSAQVEFVSPTSQLVGKNIDQITLKLRKTGLPVGNVEVGVFDANLDVKKTFGVQDVSEITSTYTDYTFSLSGNELYTIQEGDRIGIKYGAGSPSAFVAVMLDRDLADPFDGANTYRQQYLTSWTNYLQDDMYMILRQTHG